MRCVAHESDCPNPPTRWVTPVGIRGWWPACDECAEHYCIPSRPLEDGPGEGGYGEPFGQELPE